MDPLAILAALGVDHAERVLPVSGGWDTSLWRVETTTERFALRVFRPQQAKTCAREAVVMRTLREAGLPVPFVHAEGVGEGRPALLLGWCEGQTVLAAARRSPWRIWQLGVAMGRAHRRIHAVRLSEALSEALPTWTPLGETLHPRVLALLTDIGAGTERSILHLDYHPLNVLTDGRTVTAVLDWANTAIGDPRADLARTVTILRLAPTPPGTPAPLVLALRGLLEGAWRSGYRNESLSTSSDPFANLDPFYVWAGTMMQRDLRPKLGRPGVWLQESDLLRINRWTMARQARIASFI